MEATREADRKERRADIKDRDYSELGVEAEKKNRRVLALAAFLCCSLMRKEIYILFCPRSWLLHGSRTISWTLACTHTHIRVRAAAHREVWFCR